MAVGSATILFALFTAAYISGPIVRSSGECMTTATTISRKLQESTYKLNDNGIRRDSDEVDPEDYHLIDPAPSSKAAIKSGPIEHGTPLGPYIRHATPPSHPKHGINP